MTLKEAIAKLGEKPNWAWTMRWFRLNCIIVQTPGRVWQAKSAQDECPQAVQALGCSGISVLGHLDWVGWDLDVGHGTTSYPDPDAAIADARKLRDFLGGRAEIRYSRSGKGVHIKHLLPFFKRELTPDGKVVWPDGEPPPACAGPALAKTIAAKVGLRADASPLGRQAFWLWTRNAHSTPSAFQLIEADTDE